MASMIRALRMFAAVVGMWAVAPFAAAETPLADAAEKADRVRVQALLKDGADANATQVDGMAALHWAAHHDDLQTAKLLLAAGANPRVANRYGVTPVSLARHNG